MTKRQEAAAEGEVVDVRTTPILNASEGIIRVDVDDTEYLFPPGETVQVARSHAGRVLKEHDGLEIGD